MERQSGRLAEVIELLGTRVKKKGGLLGEARVEMPRVEFDRVVEEYEPSESLEEVRNLSRELEETGNRERSLQAEIVRLGEWQALESVPAELYEMESVVVIMGKLADEEELNHARDLLREMPAEVQRVGTGVETGVPVLVVSAKDAGDEVARVVGSLRFEVTSLKGVRQKPVDAVASLREQASEAARRRGGIEAELVELTAELPNLKAAADGLGSARDRAAAERDMERTQSVLLVAGWVRERDYGRLEKLVHDAGDAFLSRVEPAEDEEPPVALVNRKVFRPFELVLDLYSMPSPKEVDPTALLAPFFAIFFGFCLTDAGYGIALVVLAAVLMRKLGRDNKLLGMLFIGGLFTIVAGALVGGWFGDLPDRLGFAQLLAMKNRLMLFNPLTNPMPFFILSLGMGYLHMMYGMVIEIVDCLRVRRVGDALLGQLPWFVALNALVALVVVGKSLPGWATALLLVIVLAAVASIVVFTRRQVGIAVAQTLWFGLFWLTLVYFAAKLGGLPAEFLYVKWVLVAAFLGMYAYSLANLIRCRKLTAVPIAIAATGIAVLGLYFAGVLPWAVPALVGAAFFFTAPANRAAGGKLLWGGYALYGATSYVGVVLSYIRIMALGMVTGGIAMAVNTVAWMVTGIPVLGVVAAIVVLVLGHTYNIAVNVLGAFVHTLRLNYVEFFPRFFSGGGNPFVPFEEENRYIAVR